VSFNAGDQFIGVRARHDGEHRQSHGEATVSSRLVDRRHESLAVGRLELTFVDEIVSKAGHGEAPSRCGRLVGVPTVPGLRRRGFGEHFEASDLDESGEAASDVGWTASLGVHRSADSSGEIVVVDIQGER
jgi:hypothetical protein